VFTPPALSGKGDGGLGRKPLPPAPPRNGEGSLVFTPPALSGKGDGDPSPQPLPETERGVLCLLPLPSQGRGTGG